MKPHEQAKAAGLKNLNELVALTGESIQTLNNWSKNKPKFFELVIAGAVSIKTKNEILLKEE